MSTAQLVVQHLPYLRRYARALTGSQVAGDAYVAATLETLVNEPETLGRSTNVKADLFRVFTRIWNSLSVNGHSDQVQHDLPAEVRLGQITPLTRVEDGNSELQLFSAFAQNEFTLLPHKLMLTAGLKLEHNEFTGAEIQPSIRGVFKPTEQQTLWSAVSRAVRTPDMLEARNTFAVAYGAPFTGPDGGLYLPTLVGNRGVRSEQLWAYELGYRIQPDRRVSIDIAAFYNDYSELISFGDVQDLIPGDPVGIAEIPWSNVLEGETHGGEITLAVSPIPWWRLTANYSLLLTRLQGSSAEDRETREQSAPRNKANLRSSLDLGRQVGIDAQLRYVDAIQAAPAYLTADLRLSYRPSELLEFSLVGQNLLDRSHLEQAPIAYSIQSEVPRGVYGKLVWHFQ